MSDSVWSHRRQPTRLPHPWDSPGKNTGVGCHFLLQYMKVKHESEVAQSCPSLIDPMDCSLPGSSVYGIFQARVLEWVAIAFSIYYLKSCTFGSASLVAQMVKRLPAMWETRVWSLGQEDPLEKEIAAHSSTLAWKIPWMKEPGRLQSVGSQRVGHNWATSLQFTSLQTHQRKEEGTGQNPYPLSAVLIFKK